VHVLILGLSSIAQRRVVPALQSLGTVAAIDVATRKAANGQAIDWQAGRVYDDYAKALEQTSADLVYVSLVNSEHHRWAGQAVRRGLHVVVDKPAFLGLRESEQMLELADQQGVCLAEATVFEYHPQTQFLQDQFAAAHDSPRRISAALSFPPKDEGDFRYQRALGGGALWDVGPYAAAAGRVLYGEEPAEVACQILTCGGPDGVDTAFSMLATYAGGRSVVGQFGFDTVYRNRVDVLGSQIGVEMDRFYTNVPGVANELRVTTSQGVTGLTGPAGDAFAAFFAHVFASIESRSWSSLTHDLHADARTLERLRQAAGAQ
jgi:predicted dehydrogenase